MSDYTKCPKCGSPESWPEINGHHSYECHSFMTNEGGFGQDDYCRRLAEITAPLRAQLEAVTKERDEAREQLEQVILERDAAFEQGDKDAKARDEWAQKRDIAIKERDEAMIEASALAVCIYENEYKKQSPNWELGHSPSIVISQINNMYAGITEQLNTARAQRDRAMACVTEAFWCDEIPTEFRELEKEIAKEKEGGE